MIGKISSIKDSRIYVNLSINVYNSTNLLGKNVIFDNRFVGEIINMSSSIVEIKLIGEFVNNVFFSGNIIMPSFNSDCRLATDNEVNIIYGVSGDNCIKLGKSLVYSNYNVYVKRNPWHDNRTAHTNYHISSVVKFSLKRLFVPVNSLLLLRIK